MLQSEYDELETEHERLTARHSKLIQDIDNKEAHWKDRLIFYKICSQGFWFKCYRKRIFFSASLIVSFPC